MAQRRTRITARVANDRGVFMISVAAELADMHPQTLRMYEARGLIEPQRSPKGTRLYSHDDVERLRRIQEMTTELGMNLAGVERVLEMEDKMARLQRKVDALERRAATLQEEIERLEEIRRSVKAEIVRYEAPGTALIPIRHVRRGLTRRRQTARPGGGHPRADLCTLGDAVVEATTATLSSWPSRPSYPSPPSTRCTVCTPA